LHLAFPNIVNKLEWIYLTFVIMLYKIINSELK
jgi:hypothetical protein